MPEVVVASFNMHAGIDGWGHPYDVAAAVERLDADVVVLQENFTPAGDAGAGLAADIADKLGYVVRTTTLAEARRYAPLTGRSGFGPPVWSRQPVGLRVAMPRHLPRAPGGRAAWEAGEAGVWGVAVLTRLPLLREEVLDLGKLPRDPAHRRAVLVEVDAGGTPLAVTGVHMSHLSDGSLAQFRRLARALPPPGVQAVVAGDMNLWGPPLVALLRGWRRAVRGRTWPAARPLAQVDHLLVRPQMRVVDAEVLVAGASDHRAVRARLVV